MLRPATLVVAYLAGGAAWSGMTSWWWSIRRRVSDPAVSARQRQMTLQLAQRASASKELPEPTTAERWPPAMCRRARQRHGLGARLLGHAWSSVVSAANRADKAERVADASPGQIAPRRKPTSVGKGPGSNGRGGS
ncbi:MAG: hypothetical protein R3E42_09510 [Burkholderiaceae bacterium]